MLGERGSTQAGSRACRQFSGCRVRPRPPEPGQGSARGAAQISGCRPLPALTPLPDRVPPLSAGPAAEKRAAAPLSCRAGTSLRRKNGPARGAEHRACRAGGSHPAAAAGLPGTLAPLACANYEELSHGAERMELRYAAQFEPGGLAACSKPARMRKSGPGRACAAPTGKIWSCCWTASPPECLPARGSSAVWCSA